jgi:hypothetical protein
MDTNFGSPFTLGQLNPPIDPQLPRPAIPVATCDGTCAACQSVAKLVVQKAASSLADPVLTSMAFSALGSATGQRGTRVERAVLGGLVGLVVGGIAQAASPAPQKWICGDCGCDRVTPHGG